LLCPAQYIPLNVLWTRYSRVTEGSYNVLAYVENPNINAGANNLSYTFKLYDKDGALISQRDGVTFAPASKIMAVFEPDLQTGSRIPTRVDFSLTSPAVWVKQTSSENGLFTSQSVISQENSSPRFSAVLTNSTVNQIKKVEAVGIVYDIEGNTIAFSRTIVELLNGNESRTIYFNWPEPFSETYARTEIVLRVLK
jgi:hypothetical protein